ncbi:hypothetical protein [Burkholderia sp. WP9]|uniref:hypothetical protein n=1 Tax=Burkholderia sp. WP9 TaxID=1500263 RepID=UPI00115F7FC3|nr:hypothetical protein [Burkholderia sp. WP9]
MQKTAFHEGAALRNFDMHRSYRYKDFTIEVDARSIGGMPGGKILSTPAGYVAVVHISRAESAEIIQRLSFGQDDGRPFSSETQALMRGYGAAESIIDGMITGSAVRSIR